MAAKRFTNWLSSFTGGAEGGGGGARPKQASRGAVNGPPPRPPDDALYAGEPSTSAPDTRNLDITVHSSTSSRTVLSDTDIFIVMKRISSFMNRRNVHGSSVPQLAGVLIDKMKENQAMSSLHQSVYSTLGVLAGSKEQLTAPIDGKLKECLFHCFRFYVEDRHSGIQRHRCTGKECENYCILPMFARRCLSDEHVENIYRSLKRKVADVPAIRSTENDLNEYQTAINLHKKVAEMGNPFFKDVYDVLYTMAGHHGRIFNYRSAVDSKLYQLLFDLFRACDYVRISHNHSGICPRHYKTESLTLLDEESSSVLEENIKQCERHHLVDEEEEMELNYLSIRTTPVDPNAPPTYNQARLARKVKPHVPPAEGATYGRQQSLPDYNLLSAGAAAAATAQPSAPPVEPVALSPDPSAPPSYHALGFTGSATPSAPSVGNVRAPSAPSGESFQAPPAPPGGNFPAPSAQYGENNTTATAPSDDDTFLGPTPPSAPPGENNITATASSGGDTYLGPTPPSAPPGGQNSNDGDLPTYEEVLTNLVEA